MAGYERRGGGGPTWGELDSLIEGNSKRLRGLRGKDDRAYYRGADGKELKDIYAAIDGLKGSHYLLSQTLIDLSKRVGALESSRNGPSNIGPIIQSYMEQRLPELIQEQAGALFSDMAALEKRLEKRLEGKAGVLIREIKKEADRLFATHDQQLQASAARKADEAVKVFDNKLNDAVDRIETGIRRDLAKLRDEVVKFRALSSEAEQSLRKMSSRLERLERSRTYRQG